VGVILPETPKNLWVVTPEPDPPRDLAQVVYCRDGYYVANQHTTCKVGHQLPYSPIYRHSRDQHRNVYHIDLKVYMLSRNHKSSHPYGKRHTHRERGEFCVCCLENHRHQIEKESPDYSLEKSNSVVRVKHNDPPHP